MKKILLTLAIALTAGFSNAQRTIDWSVEQIISPTSVVHGQPIVAHIVCKNNGTDNALPGDSLYSRIFLNNGQLVSQWQLKLLTDTIKPNDTIHHVMTFAAVSITGLSFSSTFIAQSVIQNRPGMSLEPTGTFTNNSRSVTIPYINDKGWGVSVNSVSTDNFMNLYPSPAADVLNVDVKMIGSGNTELSLIDMTGRVVYSSTEFNTASGFRVDVSGFEKGVYLVQIKNGEFVSTSKVSIR